MRQHRSLGVGLHFDLGEWAPRNGTWIPLYDVVPLDDVDAVGAELLRQLASFATRATRSLQHAAQFRQRAQHEGRLRAGARQWGAGPVYPGCVHADGAGPRQQ